MPVSEGARRTPGHVPRHVYRVYHRGTAVLLYVGSTNDPERRKLEHHHLKRYRLDEVRYEVDAALPYEAALVEERRQVWALQPLDNERLRSLNPRRDRDRARPRRVHLRSGAGVLCGYRSRHDLRASGWPEAVTCLVCRSLMVA